MLILHHCFLHSFLTNFQQTLSDKTLLTISLPLTELSQFLQCISRLRGSSDQIRGTLQSRQTRTAFILLPCLFTTVIHRQHSQEIRTHVFSNNDWSHRRLIPEGQKLKIPLFKTFFVNTCQWVATNVCECSLLAYIIYCPLHAYSATAHQPRTQASTWEKYKRQPLSYVGFHEIER